MSSFQAQIADVVPLGPRFLLSVRGASRRPELPCQAAVEGSDDTLLLLEMVSPPALWLLGEVTLVAEVVGPASGRPDWRRWSGRILSVP